MKSNWLNWLRLLFGTFLKNNFMEANVHKKQKWARPGRYKFANYQNKSNKNEKEYRISTWKHSHNFSHALSKQTRVCSAGNFKNNKQKFKFIAKKILFVKLLNLNATLFNLTGENVIIIFYGILNLSISLHA
jgi:hypothetical protein